MITGALLDHLWQSTLCALGAGLLTLALRSNAARVRYGVWFAASLKFLVPFQLLTLIGSRFHWRHAQALTLGSGAFDATLRQVGLALGTPLTYGTPHIALRGPAPHGLPVAAILMSCWALGCAVVLARWAVSWARVRTAVRESAPADIAAPVPVRFTQTALEPGVVGILRPVLLLPARITERLTAAQLQAVLAHELCHVRRRDNLTAAVHMAIEAAFWFHPLIWWIGARLVEERERACDEAVLQLGNDTQTYAEGILRVCRFYLESNLTCVAGVSGAGLKQRIEAIMNNRVASHLGAAKKLLLATVVAAAIAVPIAAGVTAAPARAQVSADSGSSPATFDSVSIAAAAPSKDDTQWVGLNKGVWTTTRVPLRAVIAMAYGVDKSLVIGAPDWLNRPLYDITAHTTYIAASPYAPPVPASMIKAMLESRFGLLAHTETQDLPVYALRVDSSGPKLNTSFRFGAPGAHRPAAPLMIVHKNVLLSTDTEIKSLTSFLANVLGRPVVDETGLKGRYDFAITGSLDAATLPAALQQQLGLTVEPTTAPVQEVVVDSVQMPTLDAPSTPGA